MKNRAKSVGELLEEWPQPCSRSDRQALCFRAVKRLARPIEMPGFFHLCSALNTGRACIITGLGWRWKTVMNPGQVASRIGCLPSASTTPCRSRARLDRSVWCGMSQRCLHQREQASAARGDKPGPGRGACRHPAGKWGEEVAHV